jgi:hypothetical protein
MTPRPPSTAAAPSPVAPSERAPFRARLRVSAGLGVLGVALVIALVNGSGEENSILAVAASHGLYNITGATKAATGGSGVISAAMWTFVVLAALALLLADRRARRAGRASILAVSPAADTAALAASS